MMDRYCSQCGSRIRRGAVYCVGCGTILSSDPPSRPVSLFALGANAIASSFVRREAFFEKENIKTIHVSCKVLNVEVLGCGNEKIQITWDESASWSLSVERRENCLQLDEQHFLGFHTFPDFFMMHQRRNLRIELPKDYCGALILENETGRISVSNFETDGRIDLITSVGHINVKNLKTNDCFRAETQAGGMDIYNINSAKYFHVTGSIDQIIMDSIRSDNIEVSSRGLVDCRKIYADTFITINTSTGGIKCNVDDEAASYTAHCHSSHGSCNLPDTSGNGPKTLRLSTGVGNIDVQFKDNTTFGTSPTHS